MSFYITSPGGNSPQDTNYMVTCLPSRKLSKLDEPDMQDTVGKVGTSEVLLWTPHYGSNIQQLCEETGCDPEDLPEAMNDREKWRERVRDYPFLQHDMMMMIMMMTLYLKIQNLQSS